MLKSTLGKAAKPGQQSSAGMLGKASSHQVSTLGGKKSGAGGVTEANVALAGAEDGRDKKRAEDAKTQKKEETSEERFMRVQICEEESVHLRRVFNLFVHEQKVLTREGKGKKELGRKDTTKKDWNKKETHIDGDNESKMGNGGKDNIDSIDWFDSKAVRVILNKLGVKDIREQDIEIMIWVGYPSKRKLTRT